MTQTLTQVQNAVERESEAFHQFCKLKEADGMRVAIVDIPTAREVSREPGSNILWRPVPSLPEPSQFAAVITGGSR